MHEYDVLILLASYNGEKYLEEQLDSILKQQYTNWKLLIRDDCSNDNTKRIITKYKLLDGRINELKGEHRLGVVGNFCELLKYSPSNKYIMFCDQDDIWDSDKVLLSLEHIKAMEEKYGDNIPLLAYCSRTIVDETGKYIIENERKRTDDLLSILSHNHIYGCTMILNPSLVKKVKNMPDVVINHDYWVALTASCLGIIGHIDKELIRYRVHASNATGGIHNYSIKDKLYRIRITHTKVQRQFQQNICFCNMNKEAEMCALYLDAMKSKTITRLYKLARMKYKKETIIATIRLYIEIAFYT